MCLGFGRERCNLGRSRGYSIFIVYMAEIIFKRALHPIGQGAFFTEQFFEDGKCIFNVVYDCGELRTNKHLIREIDNTLNVTDAPEVIDVMFISHLDEDHISGVDVLIDKGCLTKDSVVVLPLHYPLVLKLILDHYKSIGPNSFAGGEYDGLMRLFDSEAKILGIDDNIEPVPNDPRGQDEGLMNIPAYSQLKSMQPLFYKSLWYYLPFNTILDDDRYQKFQDALKNAHIDADQLANITYVKQVLDKLIDIYQNLPKSINGVTAINVNSLNVLSYAARDEELGDWWINYLGDYLMWHYPWEPLACDCRCSCLYTGDSVMDAHFEKCLESLIQYITPYIGMLQIPHHGRKSCYDWAIAGRKEILTGFTNFNSTHKANKFVMQIVHDFSVTNRPFFQVTEYYHSRLEMYVHLKR